MSQGMLTIVGATMAAALLVLLAVRTVLVEVRAGRGGPAARSVRRTRPVLAMDIAGWVLMIALLVILMQPLVSVALAGY